jgi:nitroreductase/NAD-dependent dihydropyrimidine dehydrogenase PreA subunit
MSLFTVDPEKCSKCSACVEECPSKIVAIAPGEFPSPTGNLPELCIGCGHCVAICPHGALSLKRMPVESCPPINREWSLGPEQAEQFLRARRSIRTYKKDTVDKSTIERLITIARYAPTGHNSQPLRWKVIHDSAEVKRFGALTVDWMKWMMEKMPGEAKLMRFPMISAAWDRGVDIVLRGAPHIVVCYAHKDNSFAPAAAPIALAYMELAAPPLGLGACWAGYFNMACVNWPPQTEALGLPTGHVPLGALILGYPKYKYHRLPARNRPVISWI